MLSPAQLWLSTDGTEQPDLYCIEGDKPTTPFYIVLVLDKQ